MNSFTLPAAKATSVPAYFHTNFGVLDFSKEDDWEGDIYLAMHVKRQENANYLITNYHLGHRTRIHWGRNPNLELLQHSLG